MIEFLENIGDYFSQHFFDEDFPKKVFDKSGYGADHIKEFASRIAPLSEKYYRFKNDYLLLRRKKDKILRAHQFHTELLDALGYINGIIPYDEPVVMDDEKIIPVRYRFNKKDKPYLYVMEMQPMIKEGDVDADGLYEQSYTKDDWEKVLPQSWTHYEIRPEVIKEALSELFLLPEEERPIYLIMLAGPKIFLIQYEKWKFDSYLLFDLEELFTATKTTSNRNLLALFYALLAKKQFISETESVLSGLEEDAHKASYGVTVTLKSAVIYAVEALANEAIEYRLSTAITQDDKRRIVEQRNSESFARELKDDCLTFVYRLLFLFYAESREDLEILPVKDRTYQKGYSLEMLRDLEMVALTTESSREGHFFSESLWKLFGFLHNGSKLKDGFELRPLDSPLFDNDALHHLNGVQFRNKVLQEIVVRLSLSERTKNKGRGRISYSNLGINQLGSVYESLLAYSGFFASEDLIEVKNAKDSNGSDGTFLVPYSRRDDFKESEILKDKDHPELDVIIPKGHFVYRLNGRDRKNSASYYTPEVLTQCTVKYTLKGILDRLKEKQAIVDGELTGTPCADEILQLKILEPAMGAAAFHNEVINQLSVAYLELKENEQQAAGRKRITPGVYKDELQKVKAYIAANNVYGVDLNPTAVELGKLSLWLNCMHKNMETPFFAHRLGAGNAVVGAWLKVYSDKECSVEYPTEGTTIARRKPIPKQWWDKAPKRIGWNKNGKLTRKQNQIYHFLLPDDNMVPSYGIRLLKDELTEQEINGFKDWKNEFKQPLTSIEISRLQKISAVIDYLLEEHYKQQKGVIADTSSVYQVYGQPAPQISTKGYDEKERLTESRNNRSAPYYKLKLVMDYWCSLWFWDVRDVRLLPSRTEWYNEIESILQIDTNNLSKDSSDQSIKELIRSKARAGGLFDNTDRIDRVVELAEKQRFFHNEIEFIEVFKERGGFDVIVGNPPWLKIIFEEKDIMGESFPELEIRSISAPKARILREEFLQNEHHKQIYFKEYIATDSSSAFMNALQNYPLLKGQQTNLYKCVIENSFSMVSTIGYIGLLHPEGIYDDPNGHKLRRKAFRYLLYHFQFVNTLKLFSEILHWVKYSINIYRGAEREVSFMSISNLFLPNTIEGSITHSGSGVCGGLKKINIDGKYTWNIDPHKQRVVSITEKELKTIAETYNDKPESTRLLALHSTQALSVISKITSTRDKLRDNLIENLTSGWHETNDVNTGNIYRSVGEVSKDLSDFVYSGPHYNCNDSFYKNPHENCSKKSHYDVIDKVNITSDFWPRTIYRPTEETEFANIFGDNFEYKFRLLINSQLSQPRERTLQSAIIPPKTTHLGTSMSITFNNDLNLIQFAAFSNSLIFDYLIKTIAKGSIYANDIRRFPFIKYQLIAEVVNRVLFLYSFSNRYTEFINRNWIKRDILLAKKDSRLPTILTIDNKLFSHSYYLRRQLEIELDVITAINLGMSLDDLVFVYEMQFPVLQQNDNDTWYDTNGNIVFTCSKGLTGVGLDRSEWNNIMDMKRG